MPCSAATSTILLPVSGRYSETSGPASSPSSGLPTSSKNRSYRPPGVWVTASCPRPHRRSCGRAGCSWARRAASPHAPVESFCLLRTRTPLRARRRTRPRGGGCAAEARSLAGWPPRRGRRPRQFGGLDFVGHEEVHHPQRSCALIRRDVDDFFLHPFHFYCMGIVGLCDIRCMAHKKPPFQFVSPGWPCVGARRATIRRCWLLHPLLGYIEAPFSGGLPAAFSLWISVVSGPPFWLDL